VLERVEMVLTGAGPEMVFQPIVNLRTGQIVGFEALARFSGPPTKTPDIWFAEAHRVGVGPNLELFAARRALAALAQMTAPMYPCWSTCHRRRSCLPASWRPLGRWPTGS
jgi:EAL domain-containing protein (putative c-di-GMP-specific phosphodiesterase class I)